MWSDESNLQLHRKDSSAKIQQNQDKSVDYGYYNHSNWWEHTLGCFINMKQHPNSKTYVSTDKATPIMFMVYPNGVCYFKYEEDFTLLLFVQLANLNPIELCGMKLNSSPQSSSCIHKQHNWIVPFVRHGVKAKKNYCSIEHKNWSKVPMRWSQYLTGQLVCTHRQPPQEYKSSEGAAYFLSSLSIPIILTMAHHYLYIQHMCWQHSVLTKGVRTQKI